MHFFARTFLHGFFGFARTIFCMDSLHRLLVRILDFCTVQILDFCTDFLQGCFVHCMDFCTIFLHGLLGGGGVPKHLLGSAKKLHRENHPTDSPYFGGLLGRAWEAGG